MRVLIIEDDPKTVKDICFYLQVMFPNVSIDSISEGLKGIQKIENESPELVILDSSLPDMDHLVLIKNIRNFSAVPLLVLSELDTDIDRARILEEGADDYTSKPLNPIELLAKIRALIRRSQGLRVNLDQIVPIGNKISINFITHEVFLAGNRVKLTPIEYKLLSELVKSEGRILTHRAILEKVWGEEYTGDHSFVKKYMYRLRSKLENDGNRLIFANERGIGYRLINHL